MACILRKKKWGNLSGVQPCFLELLGILGHMLQSVVTANASAVVLSHNHPGGTLRPSQADVKCTLDALASLFPLQISLLDHIIIADGNAVSIRDNGFISSDLWLRQDPKSKLLRDWLSCS